MANYDNVWGSILENLYNPQDCPLGKMITMSGALYTSRHLIPYSAHFPSSGRWLLSLFFSFSPKLQIDNSMVQFKHISMNYFVWGFIHHSPSHSLFHSSAYVLLFPLSPKLRNVSLHIQFIFDSCISHLQVNEFIGKKGGSLEIYTFLLIMMT